MPLTTPATADEVIARAITDVEQAMAAVGAKPSLENSWLLALIEAQSNRVFDFYFALDQAALEALPDTAVANLERWAAIYGITRNAGSTSSGKVVGTGVVGSVVPLGTVLATGDGKRYATIIGSTSLTTKSLAVASITRVGSTATLTTVDKHRLTSAVKVNVTGAVEPEYNVSNASITVVDANTITYEVTGTPTTPATGTILLGADTAEMTVESEEAGSSEDQAFDAALRFESPIAGLDDVARVDFDELGGGADRETNTALRARLLDRIQNPVAHFSVADIRAKARTVPGVTRVFVQEITPAVGQVTIYFMRDDDTPAIPSGSEVAAVKAKILEIKPANSDDDDVIVLAPTAVPTDFAFSALTPNTATMKAAVAANLQQLFSERTTVGVDVPEDAYRSAIFNTVDPDTGDVVESFTIPVSGPISITTGEIATLGNVTFP